MIDEDVPASVGNLLGARGHKITLARDEFGPKTPDEFLAWWGDQQGAVVVTCNAKDFNKLVRRVPAGGRRKFRGASLLTIECQQSRATQRLQQVIELVEFEYAQGLSRSDTRLFISIRDGQVVIRR